jgi:hypothetical protein
MAQAAAPPSTKILLDAPCPQPALGFASIAAALASIVVESEPRFAVGVFGGWGSGKTTLMGAMKAKLMAESDLVIVDFNAWRFEREPLLLVPLLDTIRGALITWSNQRDAAVRERVRAVVDRIGRVVRALATGLSGEVGLPGAVKVRYDVARAVDALGSGNEADRPQSLYVGAFTELSEAFAQFESGGVTRVVVFVDDLDRCLPSNALDVLESMKLFFDLPGFVFVVGLDEDVVERAVRTRFDLPSDTPVPGGNPDTEPGRVAGAAERLSRDYIKKMFQVPFGLPPMVPAQLDDLLDSMYRDASLGPEQLEELRSRVRPHVEYVAVEKRINPREVKRFINAFTLQTLIRPELDRDTLLALQVLAFRFEWESLYELVVADSDIFVDALRRYRAGDEHALEDLSPDLGAMPVDLAGFLRSSCAEPLIRYDALDAYLSSLQAHIEPHNTILIAVHRPILRLRREALRRKSSVRVSAQDALRLSELVTTESASLTGLLTQASANGGAIDLTRRMDKLQIIGRELSSAAAGPQEDGEVLRSLVNELYNHLERMHKELQVLRSF